MRISLLFVLQLVWLFQIRRAQFLFYETKSPAEGCQWLQYKNVNVLNATDVLCVSCIFTTFKKLFIYLLHWVLVVAFSIFAATCGIFSLQLRHVRSSSLTRAPALEAQTLSHRATRQVPLPHFLKKKKKIYIYIYIYICIYIYMISVFRGCPLSTTEVNKEVQYLLWS